MHYTSYFQLNDNSQEAIESSAWLNETTHSATRISHDEGITNFIIGNGQELHPQKVDVVGFR